MKPTARERYHLIHYCRDRWGLKYKDIGKLFGISRQRAAQIYREELPEMKTRIKTIWFNGNPKRLLYFPWN